MSAIKGSDPSSRIERHRESSPEKGLSVSQDQGPAKEHYRREFRHRHPGCVHQELKQRGQDVERPHRFDRSRDAEKPPIVERPRGIERPREFDRPRELERSPERQLPLRVTRNEPVPDTERPRRETEVIARLVERGRTRDLEKVERVVERARPEHRAHLETALREEHKIELKEVLGKLEHRRSEREAGKTFQSASEAAKEVYEAMRGGVTGAGTDERRLFRALANRSPEQIERIRQAYREHYGRDLDKDLRSELKDNQRYLEAVGVLLKGNRLDSAAAILKLETGLPAADYKQVIDALRAIPPKQLEELKALYKERYGETLEQALGRSFKGPALEKALALARGGEIEYQAIRINELLRDASPRAQEKILEMLRANTPEKIAELCALYEKRFGVKLEEQLRTGLAGFKLEEAGALLQGDRALAQAIRLREAAIVLSPAKMQEAFREILEGRSPEERRLILDAYMKRFGRDLGDELKELKRIPEPLRVAIEKLVETGHLERSGQLFVLVRDGAARTEQLKAALSTLTGGEIERASRDLKERFNFSLDREIDRVLRGRDGFDVKLALLGRPRDAQQKYWNIEATHRFEREVLAQPAARRAIAQIAPHGARLDENMARLKDNYRLALEDPELFERPASPFGRYLHYVEDDLDTYRKAAKNIKGGLSFCFGLLAGLTSYLALSTSGLEHWQVLTLSLFIGLTSGLGAKAYGDTLPRVREDLIEEVRTKRRSARRTGKTRTRRTPPRTPRTPRARRRR